MARFSQRLDTSAVVLLPLLLTVAGCENLDSLFTSQSATPATPPAAEQPVAIEPSPTAKAVPVPTPRPPPREPAPEIKLVGLSQSETETLLGPPSTSLDRPPAKVWQYRAGDCALDVYFYLDVGRNAFYALHYDSPGLTSSGTPAPATASVPDAERCLRRVYNAHRQP